MFCSWVSWGWDLCLVPGVKHWITFSGWLIVLFPVYQEKSAVTAINWSIINCTQREGKLLTDEGQLTLFLFDRLSVIFLPTPTPLPPRACYQSVIFSFTPPYPIPDHVILVWSLMSELILMSKSVQIDMRRIWGLFCWKFAPPRFKVD